jgi:hypothetical protein
VDEETVRTAAGEVADLLTAAGLALAFNPS